MGRHTNRCQGCAKLSSSQFYSIIIIVPQTLINPILPLCLSLSQSHSLFLVQFKKNLLESNLRPLVLPKLRYSTSSSSSINLTNWKDSTEELFPVPLSFGTVGPEGLKPTGFPRVWLDLPLSSLLSRVCHTVIKVVISSPIPPITILT